MRGKKLARLFDLAGNRVHGQPTQRLLEVARSRPLTPVHACKRDGPGGWWEYCPPELVDGCRRDGVEVRELMVN